MGGSKGGGSSTTNTVNNIPPELSGLTTKTAGLLANVQDIPGFNPADYIGAHPTNVPGLSQNQQAGINYAPYVGGPTTGEGGAFRSLTNANQTASQSSLPYASQSSEDIASRSGRATGGTLATDPSI